ncbi:ricin-type beta-trefoil lectin domain protein [Streptomyces aureus]
MTGYQTQQFDNFDLTPGAPSPQHLGPVTSGLTDTCLEADNGADADGTRVLAGDCNGSAGQTWWWGNGQLRLGSSTGKCLDVTGAGTEAGSPVELWECNGGGNQQWVPQADGTLQGQQSGRCLRRPEPRQRSSW